MAAGTDSDENCPAPGGSRLTPREPVWPLVALFLIGVLIAGLLFAAAGGSRFVSNDEATFILLGRNAAEDPLRILTLGTARGPERGIAVLSMLAALATGSAIRHLEVVHLLVAVAQALVLVPVYLAARVLNLSRWQAVLVAAIAATGSFAVYGAFALNTTLGVLSMALLLFATLRSVARPGPWSDLAIVGCLVLVALSRVGWLPLGAAVVPALVAGAVISTGGTWRARARQLPATVWRAHWLLLAFIAAAVVLGLVLFLNGSIGAGYGADIFDQKITIAQLWDNIVTIIGHVAVGVAILPMIFAIPLLARNLGAPQSPETGALAWFTVSLLVVFMYVHYWGTNEDRYLAVLAPCVLLGAGVAVFKRPPFPVWAVAGTAVLVGLAVRSSYVSYPNGDDPFAYFTSPTSTFVSRVVFQRVTAYLPLDEPQVSVLFLVLCGLLAVGIAIWLGRDPEARTPAGALAGAAGAVVIGGLLVFQLAAMVYPVNKYVAILGMKSSSPADLSFIDRSSAQDGFTTAALAPNGELPRDLFVQMPLLSVLNEKLGGGWAVGTDSSVIDPRTGRVTARQDAPRLLLYRAGYVPIGLDGEDLPVPKEFAYAGLKRLSSPAKANWLITGAGPAGYAQGAKPVRLRVFNQGDDRECISGNLLTDPRNPQPLRTHLLAPGRTRSLTVASGQVIPFAVRLQRGRTDVLLKSQTTSLGDQKVGVGFFDLKLGPCAVAN